MISKLVETRKLHKLNDSIRFVSLLLLFSSKRNLNDSLWNWVRTLVLILHVLNAHCVMKILNIYGIGTITMSATFTQPHPNGQIEMATKRNTHSKCAAYVNWVKWCQWYETVRIIVHLYILQSYRVSVVALAQIQFKFRLHWKLRTNCIMFYITCTQLVLVVAIELYTGKAYTMHRLRVYMEISIWNVPSKKYNVIQHEVRRKVWYVAHGCTIPLIFSPVKLHVNRSQLAVLIVSWCCQDYRKSVQGKQTAWQLPSTVYVEFTVFYCWQVHRDDW